MRIGFVILLLASVMLNSCSVKKRAYRPGFYISSNSKHAKSAGSVITSGQTQTENRVEVEKEKIEPAIFPSDIQFASGNNELIREIAPALLKPFILKDTSCGDVLTLKKGTEVIVKVLEINETQIKYKRCDNLDGPLIVIHKNDVYSIKYRNGYVEHFERILTPPNSEYPYSDKKEVHPLAWVTLGCTLSILFTSFFGLIAVLIVAPIARRKILENPQKYEGLKMVRTCQIICYTLIALAVLLILIAVGVIFI
ncbi:MAG: hypothetical protein HYX39_01050 [Bacteroidetes bacterium]|nr:hypothetical protein [Bacteroidota bacterium]